MMRNRLKIGLALIVIGVLIISMGYIMLDDFREREEEPEEEPEETLLEHGVILAMNFCGIVFFLAGLVLLIITLLDKGQNELSKKGEDKV